MTEISGNLFVWRSFILKKNYLYFVSGRKVLQITLLINSIVQINCIMSHPWSSVTLADLGLLLVIVLVLYPMGPFHVTGSVLLRFPLMGAV